MDLGGAAAGEDRAAPSEGETEWALTWAEKGKGDREKTEEDSISEVVYWKREEIMALN